MSGDDAAARDLVDGFEGFHEIGTGGFSTVYGATEIRMGRPVAIKVLHGEAATADRSVFERECRAMGILSRHPNIVTVYSDADTVDGRPCLIMERYDGTYRQRIATDGALPVDEVLDVGVKIAGALQAAHDDGVLHRDIKPHNIFVSDFGEPALGDFGISSIDDERTLTGVTAFSVAYCSPEVLDDDEATFLSDVYSLSATLFHMLAGRPPFEASQISGVIRQILDPAMVPDLDRPDVPTELAVLLATAMSADPSRRPESAGAFGGALQEMQAHLGSVPTSVPLRRDERFDPQRAEERDAPLVRQRAPQREHGRPRTATGEQVPSDLAAVDDHLARHRNDVGVPGDGIEATVRRRDVERPMTSDTSDDAADGSVRRDGISIDLALAAVVIALLVFAAFRLL